MCKNLMCSSDDCEVPYGLCHCGCGGVVNISPKNNTKRGFIKGEYFKHIKNHNKRKSPVDYIINAETGCWEWQRGKGPNEYGYTHINGKNTRAHKHYYEQKYGPIPPDLELDHICRNTCCVNPDHLEPVTHTENMRRGSGTKLNWKTVCLIRENDKKKHISNQKIADLYGVHKSTISGILLGKSWREA